MATKLKTRRAMATKGASGGGMKAPGDAVLTLKINEPAIRKGRVSIPDTLDPAALGKDDFFLSPSIEQLAASQGIEPLRDVNSLSGLLSEAEVEDFIAVISNSREKH